MLNNFCFDTLVSTDTPRSQGLPTVEGGGGEGVLKGGIILGYGFASTHKGIESRPLDCSRGFGSIQ